VIDASPDGKWLIAGGHDPDHAWPLHLWRLGPGPDVRHPIPLVAPEGGGAGPHHAFSHHGRWLATSTHDSGVLLWKLEDAPVIARAFAGPRGAASRVLAMRFRPDGRLAIAWSDGIDVVDPETGAAVASHRTDAATSAILSPAAAWCVADREDGRWLASTTDLSRGVQLSPPSPTDEPIAIDDRARWLVTGQTMRRRIAPIDPYGPRLDPIDLGTPPWLWLAPDGDLLITLDSSGRVNRMRLDATRALDEQLVCRPG
jgi:WD40 repeat protein